jgi:hypothetical protein
MFSNFPNFPNFANVRECSPTFPNISNFANVLRTSRASTVHLESSRMFRNIRSTSPSPNPDSEPEDWAPSQVGEDVTVPVTLFLCSTLFFLSSTSLPFSRSFSFHRVPVRVAQPPTFSPFSLASAAAASTGPFVRSPRSCVFLVEGTPTPTLSLHSPPAHACAMPCALVSHFVRSPRSCVFLVEAYTLPSHSKLFAFEHRETIVESLTVVSDPSVGISIRRSSCRTTPRPPFSPPAPVPAPAPALHRPRARWSSCVRRTRR